ncbi:MAG: hypothetical protein QF442_02310, partial [Candidatus Peribacteraceae bacterium]|nr:hypothetical protein [Candidatus Peribacteraceae bacterium]
RVGNKPLWHSTSSYSLRKALEEGLSGGHGNYSGESVVTRKGEVETQKGLSVTHPDHVSAESFQQLFARLSARKEELPEILAIDSQQLTGKTLPEVFTDELLSSLSDDEMRSMLAQRLNVTVELVSDEMLRGMTGDKARQEFIADFNSRQYAPDFERISSDVLPHIPDTALREELAHESEHPFPCMITLESDGKERHLTTISRGVRPTHIPFEDFFWDKFSGKDIKEVRVPMSQIGKVRGWLQDKGLDEVNVVPIEVYEMKRIIQEQL